MILECPSHRDAMGATEVYLSRSTDCSCGIIHGYSADKRSCDVMGRHGCSGDCSCDMMVDTDAHETVYVM